MCYSCLSNTIFVRGRRTMSKFDKLQKDIEKELKKNVSVQTGPNASEYMKFLEKTLEKAQTFNTESPTYVNYAIGEKPKQKKKDSYDPSKLKKKSDLNTTATTAGDGQKVKKAKNPAKVSK